MPTCNDSEDRADVWFTFNFGSISSLTLSVGIGNAFQLWEGNCDDLTAISELCGSNQISFDTPANKQYYLQLWANTDPDRSVDLTGDFEIIVQDATLALSDFDDMTTGLGQFDSIRLIGAIDAKLSTMGLTRSDNPDFFIDIQSQEVTNRNSSNIGVGVGGGFGVVSVGVPIGSNQNTREIVIDFVDKKQNERLFWQAVSESTYKTDGSVEKREVTLEKLVDKIFAGYPPKK